MPTLKKYETPFSTHFSGNAKETEWRLRNIFQWEKRRPPMPVFVAAFLLALSCGSLVGCRVQTEKQPVEPLHAVDPVQKIRLTPRYNEKDPSERQTHQQAVLDRVMANRAYFQVPDARKGEKTLTLEEAEFFGTPITKPGVVRLASYPLQNIYLYGYCDAEHFGEGLILDRGATQTLYWFPYCYSSAPLSSYTECLLDESGTRLYLRHANGSSNPTPNDLIVLDWSDGKVQASEYDVVQIGNAILDAVEVEYDTEAQKVRVYVNDTFTTEHNVTDWGFPIGENDFPMAYNCLDWGGLRFEMGEKGWQVQTSVMLEDTNGVPIWESALDLTAEVQLLDRETGRCQVAVHTPTAEITQMRLQEHG